MPQPKPQYEILAIHYATIPDFAVSGLVAGAEAGRKLDIAMMVLPGGKERTQEEYAALAAKCGLRLQKAVATQSPYSILEFTAA